MHTLVKLDLRKPHQKYFLKSGQQVPGTTSVLRVLEKPAIPIWYGTTERAGILDALKRYVDIHGFDFSTFMATLPITEDGEPKLFATTKRDAAASTGSICHARIEAFFKGTDIDPDGLDPELYKQSTPGLERFKSWFSEQGLRVTHSEFQMVSEARKTGGTGDLFCETPRGGRIYVDLKTSNPSRYWPYPDTIAQTAEYSRLFKEVTGLEVTETWAVRVGKSKGDTIQPYKLLEAERAWGERLFDAALMAYEARYQVDKMRH